MNTNSQSDPTAKTPTLISMYELSFWVSQHKNEKAGKGKEKRRELYQNRKRGVIVKEPQDPKENALVVKRIKNRKDR